MKTFCKKLLACCLAVCMVVTLCVSGLTVGAAMAASVVVTAEQTELTTASGSAVVEVTTKGVTIDEVGGMAAARINLNTAGLEISQLEIVSEDKKAMISYAEAGAAEGAEPILLEFPVTEEEGETPNVSTAAPNVIDGVFTYVIHTESGHVMTDAVTLKITFVIPAEVADYTVLLKSAEACYDAETELLDIDATNASCTLTVAQAEVHEHVYTEEVTTQPTCTEPGVKTFTCECGEDTYTEAIDALGHTEVVDEAVAATCTETGLTEGKHCSVCNEVIVAQEEVAALGHTEVVDEAVAATCTETGLTEGKHCSVCNEVIVAQEVVDALGHAWDEGVINPDATCTDEGVKTYTCATCGETKTEAVSAKGHTEVDVEAVAPTCTETGLTAGKKCSVCGAFTVPQEEVAALGHTEVIDEAVAATCTETGLTEGKHCSVCNEVIVAQEVVDALGHDYGTPVDNEDGTHTATCANDANHTVTEEHTYTDGTCVCGAEEGPSIDPDFDTSLRFMVGIVETVGVNVVFTKPEKYDSFKVKVNRNAFDNSYNYTPATEIVWEADDAYMTSGNQYGFRYRDVPLYAMSEQIVFTFEGYEDGVLTGISNPYYWRLDDFVASYVNNNATAAKTRELYSEVLWLGEYARINFKNSAASTASIQSLESPVAKISTQPIADYTIPDVSKEVAVGPTVTFSRTMVGVTTAPVFKVIMSGMTEDIRANATFTAIHTSNLLGEQPFSYSLNKNDAIMMQSGTMNAYTHSGIALYDSDKLIEFKVEKDGEVLGSYTTSLAIETYQAKVEALNQGKTDTANMYDRVLILGEVARNCFE